MTKRRRFEEAALRRLRDDRSFQEIAARHKGHPTQFSTWSSFASLQELVR